MAKDAAREAHKGIKGRYIAVAHFEPYPKDGMLRLRPDSQHWYYQQHLSYKPHHQTLGSLNRRHK